MPPRNGQRTPPSSFGGLIGANFGSRLFFGATPEEALFCLAHLDRGRAFATSRVFCYPLGRSDPGQSMSLSFNNLRNAVLVLVLLPLLAVLVALGMLALREFEQQMELRMQEDIELVARSIRLPISAAMVRRDAMDVQQALDSAFQLEQVFGVYVYDSHGD
ncbi:MAG: hypothetical protein LC667_03795, partial [Thioalkalivibrio sp.]|nr:hypothetical protein [Thioalkalivibrio sp.]